MGSKILDAKKSTFSHGCCPVRQTLVEKWKQVFRLQVRVEMWLFRMHCLLPPLIEASLVDTTPGIVEGAIR